MLATMIVGGAGLALYLTLRSLDCLGRLGERLLRPPLRRQRPPRPLDRKMAQNQQERHRRLLQRPRVMLLPHHGRNGGSHLRHSRSLRG